jgi:ATP-dependent Lon protease
MELPAEIGVMVLPGATLFPQAMLPLYIFEPRYRKMLRESLESHRLYCVAMRRPGATREVPEPVAGLGLIRASVGHKNGTSHLILQGLTRIRLGRTVRYKPYRVHEIEPVSTTGTGGVAIKQQLKRVKELVAQRLELGAFGPQPAPAPAATKKMIVQARDILRYLNALEDPEQVADMVACSLLQDASHRQTILETVDLELRLRHLASCLGHEIHRLTQGESNP